MVGIVEDLIGQPLLDDPATLHHHQSIGKQANDRKVMCDQDHSDPDFPDKPAQEVEQTSLHGNIKAPGWLVHEDEPWLRDEVSGDLQALLR